MARIVRFLPTTLCISFCLCGAPVSAQTPTNTIYLNQETIAVDVALCQTRAQAIGAANVAAWVGSRAGDAFLKAVCELVPPRVCDTVAGYCEGTRQGYAG